MNIYSLRKTSPIKLRHNMRFQMVHGGTFFPLIQWKCFQWGRLIIKLSQNTCIIAGNERTGCVAVILQQKKHMKFTRLHTLPVPTIRTFHAKRHSNSYTKLCNIIYIYIYIYIYNVKQCYAMQNTNIFLCVAPHSKRYCVPKQTQVHATRSCLLHNIKDYQHIQMNKENIRQTFLYSILR